MVDVPKRVRYSAGGERESSAVLLGGIEHAELGGHFAFRIGNQRERQRLPLQLVELHDVLHTEDKQME